MNEPIMEFLSQERGKVKEKIDLIVEYKLAELGFQNYNLEVVKAAAVLLRSSFFKKVKNSRYYLPNAEEINVCENEYMHLRKNLKDFIKRAVKETEGVIVISGENVVDLYYTKCCGGGTVNSEDMLGHRIGYLRRVLCKYCSNSYKEKTINIIDIKERLDIKGTIYREYINNIFKNVRRDETGRIIEIDVMGKVFTGEEFMKFFDVESSRVYFMEESIKFKVIGEGLGFGICLEGAQNLASTGASYKDIIGYYYTGIEFKEMDVAGNNKPLLNRKIVIDSGHGGKDIGNINTSGAEKDINLKIGMYLEEKLKEIGANILMTRSSDVERPLGERSEFINKERPDFFISIHQNSFVSPGVNGVEAYCYDNDQEAIKLGGLVCKKINEKVDVKNRGVRIGDYYLLRECKVSGLILECMYMSGYKDVTRYNDQNYRLIAEAIFDAICLYYGINP